MCQLMPVHLRHHDIGEQKVERLGREKGDCIAAVSRRCYRVTGAFKGEGEEAPDLRFVINN